MSFCSRQPEHFPNALPAQGTLLAFIPRDMIRGARANPRAPNPSLCRRLLSAASEEERKVTYEQLVLARMKHYRTTRAVVELAARVFWGDSEDEYQQEREEARRQGASTLDDYMRHFANSALHQETLNGV